MAAPEELDLDPIEPEPEAPKAKAQKEPKAKAGKPTDDKAKPADAKAKASKPKARKNDDDDEESAPRKSVAGDRKVPYPASPPDVPEGLTDYADSYTKQQNLLLAGLFVFLIFYIGMVLFFGLVGFWCVWSLGHLFLLKVIGITFSGIFFLYLVKGFFKSHPMNKDMHIEITEEEHPVLFEFIYQLCDELGAPLPNKVFVSADVNAAVMPRTSLINLFFEPKKDLLIGLGLVNSVNLSEFKAVLAHEFGHFSQSAMASSYTYVASRIIGDLVEGEDWFDRLVNWCKKQENVFAVVGYAVGAPLWVGRKILEQCYKAITLQRLAVSREREFHADLVAVSAAGSNAVVHCLLRTEFGHQCFMQALNDMATAIDHKLYSNDMYMHQDRAAAVVRRKKKEPQLGLPPLLKTSNDGKDIEVFDAEEEELTDEIPPMWRTHPSNSDREKNAKEQFVPAVVDNRSPWILFDEPGELRERMTYKFYRMVFKIPKNANLAAALKVQKFIDNEHADTTYDPKYKGAYDDRPLEPGDIAELNALVRDTPWTEERMEKVLDKLYDGCEEHAEAHSELYKEMQSLKSGVVGRPSPKMKRKMEEVEKKQDENWEWFKSFDRRVYLLHIQMAAQADPEARMELVERYRFQLEVQRLYQESRAAFQKAEAYLGAYAAAARGEIQVSRDFAGEVIQVLRESWKALKNIIKDAREINLPAMKNFEEGESLADFILEGKMVPEPPISYVKGAWIDKLMTQLQGVRLKCFRLHFKSVGGILRMHEAIALKWRTMREPVAAEVMDAEPIPAEVVPNEKEVVSSVVTTFGKVNIVRNNATDRGKAEAQSEPIAAEIIAAEVLPDEPVAAEIIEAEVLPPEPAHGAAPEPPKSMAAFVSSAAPGATRELRSPPPTPAAPAPSARAPEPPAAPEPPPIQALPSADPFDFGGPVPKPPASKEAPAPASRPTAPPAAPAPRAPEPPPIQALPSADPFDFRAPVPQPAAPAPASNPGTTLPALAKSGPATPKPAEPPAPTPAAQSPASDDDFFGAPAAPSKPTTEAPNPAPVPTPEIFALDPEESAPAKPTEEVFSLDADDHLPAPVSAPVAKAPAPAKAPNAPPSGSTALPAPAARTPATAPAPVAAKPALSGVVEVPAPKPGFGSGVSPALGKTNGKRPRLKITMVKPGEKSPLAK